MKHYVIKLKGTELYVAGFAGRKALYDNQFYSAMQFTSLIFLFECTEKYMKNDEYEVYEIVLKEIQDHEKQIFRKSK